MLTGNVRAAATAARVAVAAVVAIAASTTSWWPLWATEPAAGAVNTAVTLSFAVTAALLWDDPDQRGTALAIAGTPVFYLMSLWWWWPVEWQRGPLPLLSFLFGYLWFLLGGYALIRYPAAALQSRWERWFFLAMAAWILVGKPLLAVITVPERARFAPGRWWPTVVEADDAFAWGSRVFDAGLLLATLGLLALVVVKLRRVGRLELLDVLPAVVAASLVAVGGCFYLLARIVDLSPATGDVLRAVTAVATLVTPVAFLVAVIRRRVARTAAVDFLRSVARATTPGEMRDEMARTLDDDRLRLWCRTGDGLGGGEYVDHTGRPCEPVGGPGRVLRTIAARGVTHAVADVDAAVARRHPFLTGAVIDAAAMALDVQTTLAEVLASRARLLNAENETRHQIGRNLHDGVQPTLAVAKTRLAAARLRLASGSGSVDDALDEARREIDTAIEEIRLLVRGQFPVLLREHGLAEALRDRTTRLPVPVALSVPDRPLHPDLELNVYYLISEALTNVVKHADAGRVWVCVEDRGDELLVVVRDDGVGGAGPGAGSGLAGMADRAHVLGGTLSIESEAACGTTIRATLPCGWPSPTTTAPSPRDSPPGSVSSASPSPVSPGALPSSRPSSNGILRIS